MVSLCPGPGELYWFETFDQRARAYEASFDDPSLDAIYQALRAAFPVDWVRTREHPKRQFSPHPFHASPGTDYSGHPVVERFCSLIHDNFALADVLGLGQAIVTLQGTAQLSSIVTELRDTSNFAGALFELEILAALKRAGTNPEKVAGLTARPDIRCRIVSADCHIELVHQQPPFLLRLENSLATRLVTLLDRSDLRDFSGLEISIDEGLGSRNEHPHVIADLIAQATTELLRTGKGSVPGNGFLCRETSTAPRSYSLRQGKGSATEALARKIGRAIDSKYQRQLRPVRKGLRVIGLDCRNLLPPPTAAEHPFWQGLRHSVNAAISDVTRRRLGLDAVLVCERVSLTPPWTIARILEQRWSVRIQTAFSHGERRTLGAIGDSLNALRRRRRLMLWLRAARR